MVVRGAALRPATRTAPSTAQGRGGCSAPASLRWGHDGRPDQQRVQPGPRGHRLGRTAHRGRDAQGARRPAGLPQADRERELRLAGGAAHDGHLAAATSTPRAPSATGSTPAARTSTPSSRSPPSTPASCSGRRTPTSSRTPASTPTWSPSGPSWPPASRRPPCPKLGAKNVNDLSRGGLGGAAAQARQPAPARHVAGRRRPPHPRLPAQHLRQDVPPAQLRHRPGDRAAGLRRRSPPRPASSSR